MMDWIHTKHQVINVYANNPQAVEHFAKLKEEREEMYTDVDKMTTVQSHYNEFFFFYGSKYPFILYNMFTDNLTELATSIINKFGVKI
jgi:hypothetical protein